MRGHYILEEKTPVEVDLMTWAQWFGTADRVVKQDNIGDVFVSTIFLGLDHSFGQGLPLLFETMIFGGEYTDIQERYTTWEEAEEGHDRIAESLKSIADENPD